jgi:hypothetical protein
LEAFNLVAQLASIFTAMVEVVRMVRKFWRKKMRRDEEKREP